LLQKSKILIEKHATQITRMMLILKINYDIYIVGLRFSTLSKGLCISYSASIFWPFFGHSPNLNIISHYRVAASQIIARMMLCI